MEKKIITISIIGVGARGAEAYGRYISDSKDKFEIVSLCDVSEVRLEKYGKIFSVAEENRFMDEEVFFEKKRSDVLLIATMDRMHVRQAMKALDLGYDLVLEKPISELGVKAIQLHTGGMCHLDADMTAQGLEGLEAGELDLAVLENVGNLVCPAEFDTGAVKNAMILSVPEGHDKPLKYPLMFSICDVVLINKIDVLPYFDFDMEACKKYILQRNPKATILPICARTGEGVAEWADWLKKQTAEWNA